MVSRIYKLVHKYWRKSKEKRTMKIKGKFITHDLPPSFAHLTNILNSTVELQNSKKKRRTRTWDHSVPLPQPPSTLTY